MPLLSRGMGEAPQVKDDALYTPGRDLRERSPYLGVRQTSLYTAAQMNPRITAAVISGGLAVLILASKARQSLRLMEARRDAVRRYKARQEARQPPAE